MSQQSKTTLQSAINTQIADNTSGDISAADIRDNLINITDSLLFNTGSGQSLTGSLDVTGGITIVSGSLTITGSINNTGSVFLGKLDQFGFNRNLSISFNNENETAILAAGATRANRVQFVSSTGTSTLSAGSICEIISPVVNIIAPTTNITGSAIISGSLRVTGSVGIQSGDITVTPSSPTTKIAITDGFMKNEMTKTSTVIANQASPYNFSLGSYIYDPVGSPFFPTSNAIYSGGATDLLISSQQKLNIEATSVEITGSLVTSGSIMGVALTSSISGTAGINYQSNLTTAIPSLQLASSDNFYNLRIFSPTLQQNYISSSHQLYLYTNSNLGIKAGNGSSAVGNVTIATGTNSGTITMTAFSSMTFTASAATYNTSTFTINAPTTRVTSSLGVTGSINLNGLITLQPLDPLPSATNGSIAYSSSGDFYFASGSAWRKLTL